MNALLPFFSRSLARRMEDPFTAMQREMNRLMADSIGGFAPLAGDDGFGPKIDLKETQDAYLVSAELPGLDAKDIEVSLAPQMVTIKGEKKREAESKDEKGYYFTERAFGAFVRAVPLPGEVQDDKVTAAFDKGVLAITLPKAVAAGPATRKVEVATK
jgi:HSP20 family protein